MFVEGLEDKTPEIRAGACEALGKLEALESIDRLSYLCQTDTSTVVRVRSKQALFSFGEVGRQAFEEIQLSTMVSKDFRSGSRMFGARALFRRLCAK